MERNAVLYGQSNCLHSGKDADMKKVGSAVLLKVHRVAVFTLQKVHREPSKVALNTEVLFFFGNF